MSTRQARTEKHLTADPEFLKLKPICDRIRQRLDRDSQSIVSVSTLLLFGLLLAGILAAIVSYFLELRNSTPALIPSQQEGEPELLDPGDGRGIKPPRPVPPARSEEAQAYMRQQAHESQSQPEHPHAQQHPSRS